MSETIESTIQEGSLACVKTLTHLGDELVKIRAGKASVSMLNSIKVDYYGNATPLASVANLSTPDSRTISIQPWEKAMLGPIEQAIFKANLGLTPMNDGEFVRITVPPLTQERRKELVKQCKGFGEDAKVGLRNSRQKMIEFVKKEVKNGYPEDAGKKREEEIEKVIKDFAGKVEALIEAKQKDIMTV